MRLALTTAPPLPATETDTSSASSCSVNTPPLPATVTVSLALRPVAAKLPLSSMEMSKALSYTTANFTLPEPPMRTLSLVPLMLEPAMAAEPPSDKAVKAMKFNVTTTGLREV